MEQVRLPWEEGPLSPTHGTLQRPRTGLCCPRAGGQSSLRLSSPPPLGPVPLPPPLGPPATTRGCELLFEHVGCYQLNQSRSRFVVGFVVRLRSATDQAAICHMESGPGWSCRLLSHATATDVVIDRHLGVLPTLTIVNMTTASIDHIVSDCSHCCNDTCG